LRVRKTFFECVEDSSFNKHVSLAPTCVRVGSSFAALYIFPVRFERPVNGSVRCCLFGAVPGKSHHAIGERNRPHAAAPLRRIGRELLKRFGGGTAEVRTKQYCES